MPILTVIVYLIVIGVLVGLMNAYAPMPDLYKRLINFVVLILVVLWLLNIFGVFSSTATVPTLRK